MQFFRTHIISKLLCFFFALHVLNVSTDLSYAVYVEEDLAMNEMESITEVICEQILQIENACPEQQEHDSHHHGVRVHHGFFFAIYIEKTSFAVTLPKDPQRTSVPRETRYTAQFLISPVTPPPKA